MPFVTLSQHHIYYETSGYPDSPPLLILSGLTDYSAKTAWQSRDLSKDFYVITFDNRGAGRSSISSYDYTIADLADDAAAVLDALSIPVADVFGFSLGGMTALHLALNYPMRLRRLVLGCTSAGGTLSVYPDEQVMLSLTQPSRSGDRRQDFLDGIWVSVSDRCMSEQPEVVDALADIAIANPQTPESYQAQIKAVFTHDVSGRLGELQLPTLVMHGVEDRLIPAENGKYLAENIPGAKLILYPEAGHLFFIEKAGEVNGAIRDFLLDAGKFPQF